jgi:biopolymer transport protein ExbB
MSALQFAWDFFLRGGPVMWPLLLCSLVAMTIVLERLFFFGRLELRRDEALLDEVFRMTSEGRYREACEKGKKSYDPAVRVLVSGLEHREYGLSDAMQMEGERELDTMKTGLSVLDTMITLAPLLGILGTVTGIIQCFDLLQSAGVQDPRAATGGLAAALITTVAGLVIAIASVLPYNYFTSSIQKTARRLEHSAVQFEVAYGRSQQRKPEQK